MITVFIFLAAVLYASVGHAGASAYLAVMALYGIAPEVMRPAALSLNILVATIATIKYARAGYFNGRLLWPFAITSVPMAFIGGGLTLSGSAYKILVGLALIFAAFRLLFAQRMAGLQDHKPVSLPLALGCGAGIGLLSGLTGVGGGIFLSPLLVFLGWAEMRQISGVSAAFILVNSIAGLIGNSPGIAGLPADLPAWALSAGVGGWLGAEFGSRRLGNRTLSQVLALVLIIAGIKMLFV